MKFVCDWCHAQIVHQEGVICLSRHQVRRRPRIWDLLELMFASHESEAVFHEACFVKHSNAIVEELYEGIDLPGPRLQTAGYRK
jgi:hypothetical protein